MSAEHPWYELYQGGDLWQGDFLDACSVVVSPPGEALVRAALGESDEIAGELLTYDLVVMTQSCDLVEPESDFLACCPRYQWQRFVEDNPRYGAKDKRDNLRKGLMLGIHLLNEWPERGMDFQVVDFRNVISLPTTYVQFLAGRERERVRLLSPYREHLAQAFARYFMRVALPTDILTLPARGTAQAR